MALIRWVGDRPEPCDFCWKFLQKGDDWIASRNPYAPFGVRFLCRECYEKSLKRSEREWALIRKAWEEHDAAAHDAKR